MFYAQQKPHQLYQMDETLDEYRQPIKEYHSRGTVEMAVFLQQHNAYTANDQRLHQVTHIGVTRSPGIQKGMCIDKRFQVEFVAQVGLDTYVYLKEVV